MGFNGKPPTPFRLCRTAPTRLPGDMETTAPTLEQLAARIERLEDERAIQAHLIRYGLAVDSNSEIEASLLYAEDTHVDIDASVFMDGRDATRGIVASPLHQAILPNCAHVMGPFVVDIDGTRATATGYATVYVREDGEVKVWRQSFGRWELERREGRWQITKRVSRSTGREDAAALFKAVL
ncbi:nuclear transport factor 2 family protein [Sphingomonas crocodyli]|uniref:Nuclear transport factor 2 family protein n=2 Tax=Sphingomonas crocodyli TaxID=1979270 RepID=A0A437M9Z2_9SPHN|nr:nuclear transport factor 2 family protein [Sphingomonas crocodyli]